VCLADGKRSRAQQQATYDDYVVQYGQAMADQYVLPPEKSAHVLGLAVDVQPYAAYTWLEGTRGQLGFCRIYDNEAWHFEYDGQFADNGCPARLPHPNA
jgi:LAS superfamily LD-carboxypeptidase LdcB